jgi:hypothetical protein
MKLIAICINCWRRLLPALAVLLAPTVLGQGIIYVHAPLSNPSGDTNQLPWDSLGTQVGPDFPIVINGQTVCIFSDGAGTVNPPSGFVIQPSSTSAVIAFQPNLAGNPLDPTAFVIPLSSGQEIGPDAAGYNWLGNVLGGDIFTAARDGGIIGQPPLTIGYFTGLESAYLGFEFQQDAATYYGWMRVGCPLTGINVGWVYDYAYETTPDTPIAAGAVPEPSSLALLAAGVATLFFRRKG